LELLARHAALLFVEAVSWRSAWKGNFHDKARRAAIIGSSFLSSWTSPNE
jgi:hypothetical protein